MKRAILIVLTLITITCTCFMTACKDDRTPAPSGRTEEEIYDKIYDGNAKVAYPQKTGKVRYLASYGYACMSEQGYNNWYYYGGITDRVQMQYADGAWSYSGASLSGAQMTPSSESDAVRRFVAPEDGEVLINGNIKSAKKADGTSTFAIYKNGEQIYPQSGTVNVRGDDLTGYWFEFNTTLKKGDSVDFTVSGDVTLSCNPVVDYTLNSYDTLYYTPEWGYYGDLHEYYYDDTVYLYHLRNLPDNVWLWYMLETKDMFRYTEVPVYTTDFVKNHYMAYEQTGDLNDYDTFPAGARDCTKFWDEDINRYRYIGLSYIKNSGEVDCSLSMRTSDDETGLLWTSPAQSLRRFPTRKDGEPECAHFRKIGNRWYLLASISAQSVHGVGRLSYWMGGEGQTIDEVDWLNAPTYYLDGEDLCAAQVEWVDEKLYMFGWMPQNYAAGYWGGYKNLPREIFVREDGTLGAKLDTRAQSLLNKGKIAVASQDNTIVTDGNATFASDGIVLNDGGRVDLNGTFRSSYITFNVTMNGDEAGLVMSDASNRNYKVKLVRKQDGVYMQVGEATDNTHPVSSEIRIGDLSETQFDVKVVVEGSIVEFFVNDSWALSARTSMGQEFSAGFYSKGNAVFSGFTVNRLAQLYDIYE